MLNTRTQTGRFYDVTGSVGLKQTSGSRLVYSNTNPFLFSGKVVVKTSLAFKQARHAAYSAGVMRAFCEAVDRAFGQTILVGR